jgi:hypothetical protein
MLYEILFDSLWLNYNPRQNPRLHADGIIGYANANSIDLVVNQLKDISLSQPIVEKYLAFSSTPTQSMDVHFVQLLTHPNGNQQPRRNRKKG